MPFSLGARLEPYEVIASIGAGGMGEVFRGVDLLRAIHDRIDAVWAWS